MNYRDACKQAKEQSSSGVQHVCCTIRMAPDQEGFFVTTEGYFVSDWFDSCTVTSYLEGKVSFTLN